MTITNYTRYDNQIALGILPLYILVLNYLLLGVNYFLNLSIFVKATLLLGFIWTPIYFLHALPALALRNRFPSLRQTWLRLSLALLTHMTMTSLTILGLFYLYDWINFPGYVFSETQLQNALLVSIAGNLIVNVIHESVYTFDRWSQTLTETERLRRANLQSQLEGLKNQVNPHFLFNSLNSLSSLIDQDPDRAEQFIEELASVYRYLLQTNDSDLTTLAAELRFIQSYFHLQQTRYGNGLTWQICVDEGSRTMLLPPLTLQLLVENAIKHNVVAADQPLHIVIEAASQPDARTKDKSTYLRVTNNLQRRQSRVLSNGIGLANIATKYQLLGQGDVQINEENGQFIVNLPLLTNQIDWAN